MSKPTKEQIAQYEKAKAEQEAAKKKKKKKDKPTDWQNKFSKGFKEGFFEDGGVAKKKKKDYFSKIKKACKK